MSRILKRPMFRKGGEVMEGIMTGIKPRKNYADGKTREEIFAEAIHQGMLISIKGLRKVLEES